MPPVAPPASDPDPRASRGVAVAALLVTAGLGLALRLVFAGDLSLPANLSHLRHAHSHAGVYALFFPLTWAAWRVSGVPAPGPRTTTLYLVASAVAVVVFAMYGYAVPSIVASTVVGVVWLFAAWKARAVVRDVAGARRLAPLAIAAATAFIPAIAVATRRDPALAKGLVHAFLALLFFLALAPSALHRVGARVMPSALFGPAAALAALHLGPWPSVAGSVGVLTLGLTVAWSAWSAPALDVRLGWIAFGLGACAMAVSPEGPTHRVAIAGLHYFLLGPLFVSLAKGPSPSPRWTWVALAGAGAMGGVIVGAPWLGGALAERLAAAAGVVWAAAATVGLLARAPRA